MMNIIVNITADSPDLLPGYQSEGAAGADLCADIPPEESIILRPGERELIPTGLRLEIPTQGIHFAFQKLYANQAEEDAWVRIPYYDASLRQAGKWGAVLAVLLIGLGVWSLAGRKLPGKVPGIVLTGGLAGLALALYFHTGLEHASVTALVLLALWGAAYWRRRKAAE